MRIVLLGPPGAGKGTLAGLIKEEYGVLHVSTGDILRAEMKSGSDLGNEMKKYVESGALVPDEVVTRIVAKKLKELDLTQGIMFDGFPRTKQQAQDLDRILKELGFPIEATLFMEVDLPVIIQRLTGRRVCKDCGAVYHLTNMPSKKAGVCDSCGGQLYQRADDNEETIRNRMDVYMSNTAPVIDYYEDQGKLRRVDASQKTETVVKALSDILENSNG
ncbi:MAG TPA: adenylate kinase [Candidatus Omnitrophota bacterium]|nr:adenylate kinase [Candidatus Omnitrophota bacterium]HSA31421.1 adenylate kinase [Candidatus Omnitrophota bacterium]